MFSLPSKSAIVLATFKILECALALNPSFSNAFCKSFLQFESSLQCLSISAGVNSEFE